MGLPQPVNDLRVEVEAEFAARNDHDFRGWDIGEGRGGDQRAAGGVVGDEAKLVGHEHRLDPGCGGQNLERSHHIEGGETGVENQGDLHEFSLWASPRCGKDALLTIPATTEPAYAARMIRG